MTHVAPATRYELAGGGGRIGVVATFTEPFCGTCNRLRLTADGALRNCLFSDDELSARDLLAGGRVTPRSCGCCGGRSGPACRPRHRRPRLPAPAHDVDDRGMSDPLALFGPAGSRPARDPTS